MKKDLSIDIKSLYDMVDRSNRLFGEYTLYRFNQTKEEETTVTYSEYYHYVRKLTLAMRELGVKDQKVILTGETSVQWIATYMATVFAGGVIVPLDPGLLPEEMVNFINLSEAKAVVYSSSFENLFKEQEANLPTVEKFIMTSKSLFTLTPDDEYVDEKFISYRSFLTLGDKLYSEYKESTDENKFDFFDQDIEKLSVLLFTSGTTGTSKGVMLSQKNIVSLNVHANSLAVYFDTLFTDKTYLFEIKNQVGNISDDTRDSSKFMINTIDLNRTDSKAFERTNKYATNSITYCNTITRLERTEFKNSACVARIQHDYLVRFNKI